MKGTRHFGVLKTATGSQIRALSGVGTATRSGGYILARFLESEMGARSFFAAKSLPEVQRIYPGLTDAEGSERFIDFEFLCVEFEEATAEVEQRAVIAGMGLEVVERHRRAGLYTARVPGGAQNPGAVFDMVGRLSDSPKVLFAEPAYLGFDDLESAFAASPAGRTEAAWNHASVRAADAHAIELGSPRVVIALLDTGVDFSHPALSNVLSPASGEDWNFESVPGTQPYDEQGHGTFIAGLLQGNGHDDLGGLAPGCSLLPIKVPLTGGPLSYARRRDAILYALGRVKDGDRLILNLSWKTTGDVTAVREALMQAHEAGALIVSSAGNWPTAADQPHYPSDYPFVISVGGVGPHHKRGLYSFYGREVDLAAPGGTGDEGGLRNIRSAAVGGGSREDFGTSFAAPHVAAGAALVWSRNCGRTASEVRAILERTAAPVSSDGLGAGLVDFLAALRDADRLNQGVPLPATLDLANSLSLQDLLDEFGLLPFTAQLIVARRPYAEVQALRNTLGLTQEQFDALTSRWSDGDFRERNAPPATSVTIVNVASQDELYSVAGMPLFCAQVIIARRPFAAIAEVAAIAGMSPDILSQLRVHD